MSHPVTIHTRKKINNVNFLCSFFIFCLCCVRRLCSYLCRHTNRTTPSSEIIWWSTAMVLKMLRSRSRNWILSCNAPRIKELYFCVIYGPRPMILGPFALPQWKRYDLMISFCCFFVSQRVTVRPCLLCHKENKWIYIRKFLGFSTAIQPTHLLNATAIAVHFFPVIMRSMKKICYWSIYRQSI